MTQAGVPAGGQAELIWVSGADIDVFMIPLCFPGGSVGKESTCNVGDLGLIPQSGRYPEGGHDNPHQYCCLENPHGQRSLAGYSPLGCKESDTAEWLSTAQHMIPLYTWAKQSPRDLYGASGRWGQSKVTWTHRWMKWFSSRYWQPQAMSRATCRRSSMAREEGWFCRRQKWPAGEELSGERRSETLGSCAHQEVKRRLAALGSWPWLHIRDHR